MTELTITEVGDTWVNGASGRTGNNYGSTQHVQVKNGERRALLLPKLPNLAGRTIVDAYLVGHSTGTDAQTLTVAPVTQKWQPGRATWGNQPSVNSGTAVAVAVGAAADGEVVTIAGLGPMIQAVADGTDWFGLRVSTSSTTAQKFYATESGAPAWELHLTVSDLTQAPDGLRPNGAAVSGARPILAWDAEDQVSFRVQVDTPAAGLDPDDVAPDFDSGVIVGVDQQFDLATSTHTPAGAGPHYWRAQVTAEGESETSEWSDWASFTVSAMPTLVIDSPTGPFGDPSPTLAAHLSSGTLSHWKVKITGPDRADVRFRSGLRTGPLLIEVPQRHKGRRTIVDGGWIHFEAADDVDRAVAVDDPGVASAWVPIVLADDDSVASPTDLVVAQVGDGDPRLRWAWQRTEAADAWVLAVDGQNFEIITAEDITLAGGVYTWTDSGQVSPLRPHTLTVRALEGSQVSEPASVTHTHTVTGVWLLPDDGSPISLNGTAVSGFANTSRYARYTPLQGAPVDVIYEANPGRMGAFAGTVDSTEDVWAVLDEIERLRSSRTRFAQLVWGSQSIRVRLVDPDATSADHILPNNLAHDVRFEFVEVDD